MEPEEFSRVIGQILGSGPVTMDDRDRVLNAMADADSVEELPDDVKRILNTLKNGASQSKSEPRAIRLSTTNRQIIKDSDQCKLCVANNDPKKVPVHPNCHCDVVTDSVETGVVDSDSRLLDVIRAADDLFEIEVVNAETPAAVQLNPETVAVFDPNDVRFGDLARWLEQMQPYLEASDQYVSIIVDDDTDEAASQIQETLSTIAENPEDLIEAIQNKKLWFGIAQAVI